MTIPYPSNYFDPFGDDPEYSACDSCGVMHNTQDLTRVGRPGDYEWLCDECLEQEQE